jgi:BlaI family transcriptional regulator, penicillinase repressor
MERLNGTEESVMMAAWALGETNIKGMLQQMNDEMPYTTLASLVKNMEKKGLFSSRLLGNTYLYKPLISEADYKKRFMGRVVRNYFDNSYKEVVNFFIEQKKLSAKELREILKMIEK